MGLFRPNPNNLSKYRWSTSGRENAVNDAVDSPEPDSRVSPNAAHVCRLDGSCCQSSLGALDDPFSDDGNVPDLRYPDSDVELEDDEDQLVDHVIPVRPRLWSRPAVQPFGGIRSSSQSSSQSTHSSTSSQYVGSDQIIEKLAAMTGETVKSRPIYDEEPAVQNPARLYSRMRPLPGLWRKGV